MNWKDQYKDPRWLKKRLEILDRDTVCIKCGSSKRLQCHHLIYHNDRMAWEYQNKDLAILCHSCHKTIHEELEIIKTALAILQKTSTGIHLAKYALINLTLKDCGESQ